jgi:short chain dehydrogenase
LTASQRELPEAAEERVLAGRVAVVTGGGRGLGRAIALALAEAGADVVVAARSVEEIERVAGEVGKRGRRSLAVPIDITDEETVERLIRRTVEELGGLDIPDGPRRGDRAARGLSRLASFRLPDRRNDSYRRRRDRKVKVIESGGCQVRRDPNERDGFSG